MPWNTSSRANHLYHAKNYYQCLQIAHMINQLVERTKQIVELLTEHSKETIVDLVEKDDCFLDYIPGEKVPPSPTNQDNGTTFV